jgi:hypothetical protein
MADVDSEQGLNPDSSTPIENGQATGDGSVAKPYVDADKQVTIDGQPL